MKAVGERRGSDSATLGPEATLLIRSAALADWLALVIVALYELTTGEHTIALRVVVAMVAFALASLILRIPRLLGRLPDLKLFTRVLATTAFIGFVVWHTGGASSPLASLYLLPIVLTALALRWAHVAGLIVLITALYIATARFVSGLDVVSGAFAARLFVAIGPFVVVAWLTAELGRQLLAARRRERDRAHADPLTGLANFATFVEAVELERHRCVRDGGRFSIVRIELDPTASEPGEHPGQAAAAALKLVSSVLSRALRDSDLAARTADQTFAAVLPGADLAAAQTVANRIRHAAHAATVRVGSRMIRIQAQCAAAESPRDGAQARELIHAAQQRLADEAVRRQNAMPMS